MDSDIFRRLDALNSNGRQVDALLGLDQPQYHHDERFYQPSYTQGPPAWSELEQDDDVSMDDFDRQLLRRSQHTLSARPRHFPQSQHNTGQSMPLQQYSTSPLPSSPLADAYIRQHSSAAQRPYHHTTNTNACTTEQEQDRLCRRHLSATTPYNHSAPIIQGIPLVSTRELPDRFRSVFSFPVFNAVQSKSYSIAYQSNDNYVLSAPTGSGKTAVLELAICRLVNELKGGMFKVVYQAPIKALCSERLRDWQRKFAPMDLRCAELTGDTEASELSSVKNADIIITTPEKWDSITRKWKDHKKLLELIKLFLIDEVHTLKDERGATLEAVVSRMKSVAAGVRFIALSATVPNAHDIAVWLGKNPQETYLPAAEEHFGEEFRPVRLARHVCGYKMHCNDYQLDNVLNSKIITDVIPKWSQKKPILIFCFTKNSCQQTAKALAEWWSQSQPNKRFWSAPQSPLAVTNAKLQEVLPCGVAFHNTELSAEDRLKVETAYLNREISVICSTSTLAVGVNLPCHMVIIKGTTCFQSGTLRPYSDLEIMQMMGRAGRPQFEQSAVSVIMTRSTHIERYENIIAGKEMIESCLHDNLVEHLNAEIGLGTITDTTSAKRWLTGTFLYVRMKANPRHYKLDNDSPGGTLDQRLDNVCGKAVDALEEYDLVESSAGLRCTELGDAMTKYFVRFETMKTFLALPHAAKTSEILACIAQALEFHDIRFKAGEKSVYKKLNNDSSIKFRIPVNIDSTWHKVSLIIQAVLGMVDLPDAENHCRVEFATAKGQIFQRIHRLVRCIVECKLFTNDSTSVRNALMLARSFGAQAWDDSALYLRQLPAIGPVNVRKLVGAGIRSVEDIENAETSRLETIAHRNPPFGTELQKAARAFPQLRVSLAMDNRAHRTSPDGVIVSLKAEIGFLNEKVPLTFNRKPVYVYFLAEISDGRKAHFAKISAKQFTVVHEVLFSASLTDSHQLIRVYVMCEDVAGSDTQAQLAPAIPQSEFPAAIRTAATSVSCSRRLRDNQEEFDDGLNDDDLAKAADDVDFIDIDDVSPRDLDKLNKSAGAKKQSRNDFAAESVKLPNGKWQCGHQCKDKTKCKHTCCREGSDNKPKPKKKATAAPTDPKQTQLLGMMGGKKPAMPTPSTSNKKRDPRTHGRVGNGVAGVGGTPLSSTLGKRQLETPMSLPFRTKAPPQKRSKIGTLSKSGKNSSEPWDVDPEEDFEMLSPSQWLATTGAPMKSSNEDVGVNFSDELLEDGGPSFQRSEQYHDTDDFEMEDHVDPEMADNTRARTDERATTRLPLGEKSTNGTHILIQPDSARRQHNYHIKAAVNAENIVPKEADAEPVDPLRTWFEQQFGTEDFNYIG